MHRVSVATTIGLLLIALVTTAVAGEPGQLYDLDGRTVSIHNFFGTTWDHVTQETLEEGRGKGHLEWVEEQFNCTIEIVSIPFGEVSEQILTGVLVGDPAADIYVHQNVRIETELAPEGALYPLDEVLDDTYYQSLPLMYQDVIHTYNTVAGRTFMFQSGPMTISEARGIIWNKCLFEREGLPSLYDLYEQGEWTWEAFREIAVDATRDTTGDGNVDQWGVASRPWGPFMRDDAPIGWHSLVPWVYTNNASLTKTVNGKIMFNLDQPEALEAMEFWQELGETGAVNAGLSIPGENVAMDYNNPGSGGEFRGEAWENMSDDYGLVPLPRGPAAEEHVAPQRLTWTAVVPITYRHDVRELIEVYNALYRITDPYRDPDWEEQTYDHFAVGARDRESVENFRWISENSQLIRFLEIVLVVDGFDEAIWDAISGAKSPAAAMSAIKPAAQVWLDETLNQ